MTLQPLSIEELDEVKNLATECDDPRARLAHIAELVRLRALAQICRRHHARMPRQVLQVLETRVPSLTAQQQWTRAVADACRQEDPRLPGATPRLI